MLAVRCSIRPWPLSISVKLSTVSTGAVAKKASISARSVGWLAFTANR